MKIKEFRIPLNMSVDEYQIAQNWSVNEQSRKETGGGEGVEIQQNKPFTGMSFLDGKYTSGQYTYKIYKVETDYIIETENSLYLADAAIATKRIS